MVPEYEAVIGLEVHCQLQTRTKAFSPDSAQFGADPNTHVDPVSLGHPGTLPVLNRQVVDHTVRIGLATDCHIEERSVLARKHYFYPDLPKGYQISQYERPICSAGVVEIEGEGGESRPIGLTRIHIEEDAGKSIHDQDPGVTLLDFNRCGVPLVEIVSEPDLRTPTEAYRFMRRIRQIVRYLEICDGNMEEGSLRCDANVSVRRVGETALGTKTEVKNLNSFRHVERSLQFEIDRQIRVLQGGGTIVQETRLWDDAAGETRPLRSKEEAHDYRYFPDPDLPPIHISPAHREALRAAVPEMPLARRRRFESALGLPAYDAELLTEERDVADYFETTLGLVGDLGPDTAKHVSNVVMTHVLRAVNDRAETISALPVKPERLAQLVRLRLEDRISSNGLQELFGAMLEDDRPAGEIAGSLNLLQVSDESALLPYIESAIVDHPAQVSQYRGGKTGLLGFFVGAVMRSFPGSPDPRLLRRLLEERLDGPDA